MIKTETALRAFTKVVARPFLQAAIVPQAPVHRNYYNGILMPGVFAYRKTYVSYYSNSVAGRTLPNQIKPYVPGTDVYVGTAPDLGIYTGVRNGRY
jgi:hypothetical protein